MSIANAQQDLQPEQDAPAVETPSGAKTLAVAGKGRLVAERDTAERAKLEQARLAKEAAEVRPGMVFKDCGDCPVMVMIPDGSFEMGGTGSGEQQPIHRVECGHVI